LNGVAVDMNRQAFLWGRRAAHDLAAVERSAQAVAGAQVIGFVPRRARSLEEIVSQRVDFLTVYRNASYARRYAALVEQVRAGEERAGLGDALAKSVARYYFKLLAPKDEWEVARLYTSPEFRQQLEQTFEGDFRLHFHVGAWPFGRVDPKSGKAVKREVGPWLMKAFAVVAGLRFLRGSVLDPFRNSEERKLERRLLAQYEADVAKWVAGLHAGNHAVAVKLASLPEKIRGFGHVKAEQAAVAEKERAELLARFAATPVEQPRAA
jgi:indolepyruvate ferredoxin oxidoreductase